MCWESYIDILKEVGARLKNDNDKLVWPENKKNGTIIAKLAYEFIVKSWNKVEQRWWYKNLWVWSLPQKVK